MSKATTDVLLWANRVAGRREAPSHELLEIPKDASVDDAQAAFHKIARLSHPDLHRTTLSAEELERVTYAYAIVAAAYQAIRTGQRAPLAIMPVPKVNEPVPARSRRQSGGVVLPGGGVVGNRQNSASRPAHDPSGPHASSAPGAYGSSAQSANSAPSQSAGHTSSSTPTNPDGLPPSNPVVDAPTSPPRGAMSSKALVYYRKAEFALKSGDVRTAQLNLRLAIAADPTSTLLRSALAEVEAELASAKPTK